MALSKDPLVLRSIIMEHYERPKYKLNQQQIEQLANHLTKHNKTESCIDDITIHLILENEMIKEVYFSGTGCAIATSSTDIICSSVLNCSIDQALNIIDNYLKMVSGDQYSEDHLNELIAFYNVKNQPNRIKCATIGIKTLKECLIDGR